MYRLREATAPMATGQRADQAHVVSDFTKMFGETPTRYVERR